MIILRSTRGRGNLTPVVDFLDARFGRPLDKTLKRSRHKSKSLNFMNINRPLIEPFEQSAMSKQDRRFPDSTGDAHLYQIIDKRQKNHTPPRLPRRGSFMNHARCIIFVSSLLKQDFHRRGKTNRCSPAILRRHGGTRKKRAARSPPFSLSPTPSRRGLIVRISGSIVAEDID